MDRYMAHRPSTSLAIVVVVRRLTLLTSFWGAFSLEGRYGSREREREPSRIVVCNSVECALSNARTILYMGQEKEGGSLSVLCSFHFLFVESTHTKNIVFFSCLFLAKF